MEQQQKECQVNGAVVQYGRHKRPAHVTWGRFHVCHTFLTWKLKNIMKLRKLYNRLYLWLSDCDGMCDSCPPELKIKCYTHKQKENNLKNYQQDHQLEESIMSVVYL